MSQPTNTFDSYDAKGNREDLQDKIYMVSPGKLRWCPRLAAIPQKHPARMAARQPGIAEQRQRGNRGRRPHRHFVDRN